MSAYDRERQASKGQVSKGQASAGANRDFDRALAILAAYGADPDRWPAAERDMVLALVAAQPAVAARRAEEALLDRLVDAVPAHAAVPSIKARILAAAERDSRPAARKLREFTGWLAALWPFGPPWQPASALAAAALLGLVVGATLQGGYSDDDYALLSFGLSAELDPLP